MNVCPYGHKWDGSKRILCPCCGNYGLYYKEENKK